MSHVSLPTQNMEWSISDSDHLILNQNGNAPVQSTVVGVVVRAKNGNKEKEFRARCDLIATAGIVNTYSKYAD